MGAGVSYIHWRSKQLAHLLQNPLATSDLTYVTWLPRDYSMMTWLLISLEEKISGSVMFLTTAKEMWDTLKVIYGNEKNPSRVFEIYERCLSSTRETDLWMSFMANSRVSLMS